MKIFITASKSAYDKVEKIKRQLEQAGHFVTPPNGFDHPDQEAETRQLTPRAYADWKSDMLREDGRIVAAHDAVLVLNFEKHGLPNYIGGATFLEMFKAFDMGKKLYLYNPIPEGMLNDEIIGLQPIVINGNLNLIDD
jgi:hypothetical protein